MSATTSSTDVGTPVHASSGAPRYLLNERSNDRFPNSDQEDIDEAIDLSDHVTDSRHVTNMEDADHVTNPKDADHVTIPEDADHVTLPEDADHVTQRTKLSVSDDSNEDQSTAEEGRDSLPNYESTTTDNFNETVEPIDFIEANPRLRPQSDFHYHANGAVIGSHGNRQVPPPPPPHRYENWNVELQLDDGTRRGRVLKRNKGSRVAKVDRQRLPYPPPRAGKGKSLHARPSPLSRKRRSSGRVMRPLQPPNASEETDMAQADEMGEGEGRDDGFIDGGGESFKRRSKKRAGGMHSILPSLSHGSPQSSPSNTPVSRRKISTRKSRLKPRTRKHSKAQLASADISTQESTTQGPGSSDTSEARVSLDEASQLRQGGELESDSDRDYEDTRSVTPNPRDVGVVNSQPIKSRNGISPLTEGRAFHRDQVSDIDPPPVTVMNMAGNDGLCSASDENVQRDHSNETSDTDLTPLPRPHHQNWTNKKFESDLSTAPFSSETSDMETSGNERILTTDGGSTTNLSSLKPKQKDSLPTPSSSPSPKIKMPTRQIQSGSSGDEIKKNRLSVKSKPIRKPSPPPKKPSVESQATPKPQATPKSQATPKPQPPKVPVVAKKPLHATKSSPLGHKVGVASPLRSQQSERGISTTRSKSIKVNIPAKPKPPPVPVKPANARPELKPRPSLSSAAVQSPVSGPGQSSAGLKEKSRSVRSEGKMTKTYSDSDLSVARAVVRRSPTMGARKLSGVREEAERRQSTPPRPMPPPTPVKPYVSIRTKRQPMERKTSPVEQPKPVERVSPVEQDSVKSKPVIQSESESSKMPPSSIDSLSGPSPSPSPSSSSLYSSPSISKRLGGGQKPAILPKKASIKSHQRAASDSTRMGRKVETPDLISPSAVMAATLSETTPIKEEPRSSETVPVASASQASEAQAPPTTGTTSPPPPPIPPRSAKAKRKSSHLELVIPVSETGSARTSPTFDLSNRKRLGAPRRPPPSPPSPLPQPATEAQPTANEPTESGSRTFQISQSEYGQPTNRPTSMAISSHYDVGVASWNSDTPPQPYMYAAMVNKLMVSPEKPRSKTPDFLLRDQASIRLADSDVKKSSDSELEVHRIGSKKNKIVRRESSRRAPPKPPKYDTPDETTGYVPVNTETMIANQQKYGSCRSPGSRSSASPLRDDTTPPPLPTQPIPKRKSVLKKSMSTAAVSTVAERPRARDPIYDVIPDVPRRGGKHREYEEIDLFEGDLPPGLDETSRETPVELVRTVNEALPHRQTSKQPQGNYAQLPIEDLRENWKTSPLTKRRGAKSFSGKKSQSLMYRRFTSERLYQRRILTLDLAMNSKSLIHRTPSLDQLDDRMDRSLRRSMHYCLDSSSSDEEDMSGIVSPGGAAGLPKVPSAKTLYSTPKSQRSKHGKTSGATEFVPPDMEPLYQYINTAEFLRDGSSDSAHKQPGQTKQNQLEIARQLSQRRLWCEQPEVIQSGLLKSLSEEEKKLQEAMFEVISSEATYLRSLDVLIDHFMDDPGMNPNLPEGRRVLDKRQHHVIFSNVREVRDVSERFLRDLERRQSESPVVKNISDIILDYAENHFECYVRYCTNQIYQSRELQDCLENSLMFREYLRRLESNKICQNLNMQSFLLLPMQRITRLPLLILAILNRTPLDYPDQPLVEATLRTVQKLVTSCNDGARKMERTEQLHEIHKKLYFGKLKPFPLVSVSRQLERKGTLVQLQVEQKLFGKRKITRKPLYVFVFTDYVIITKKKKDPKGDFLYKVVDHASRALVDVESIETLSGMTFPKPSFGDQEDPVTEAMWAVSVAADKHAFLVIILDNVNHQTGRYLFLASNDTDKTRWLDSLRRQDVEREDEKIYQTWDCPQVQAVFDYKAKQPDELDLQRGDVVKVYRKMADGWYEGERLRDLQCGWFPSNFTMEVQNEHTRARNLRETHRLNSLLAANDMILSSIHHPAR